MRRRQSSGLARRKSFLGSFGTLFVAVALCRLAVVQCSERPAGARVDVPRAPRAPAARVEDSVHLALGVPRDADPSDDRLLDQGSYVVSYNRARNVANWVAWRLDSSYLGHVKRRDEFRPDPLLPSDWYRVSEHDYRRSGYDRGHLCPSADREDSAEDNASTFLFSNIVPQVHELNSGPWEELEKLERERARRPGAVLYIVAGGIFREPCPRIGGGVAVPSATFKIIAVLREGETAAALDASRELIAVQMPNERAVAGHDMREYLTSVDRIEAATGYDFLSRVPLAAQAVLEARTASL